MLNPLPVNPKQITFKFPTRTCGFDPSNLAPPVYSLSQSTTLPGVNIGSLEFTEDALALFTPATSITTPTNNTALQTLIQQFSTDFLNWRQTQFDIVLAGIANVAQNGLIQVTEFDYNSDMCRTRITSLPDNFPPDRLAHQLSSLSADCPNTVETNTAEPCFKAYGPPTENQTSGSTTLDEYLLCFEDGRLTEKFLQRVTYPCACSGEGKGCLVTICVQTCSNFDGQSFPVAGALVTVTGSPTPPPPGNPPGTPVQCVTVASGGGIPGGPFVPAKACCVVNVTEAGLYLLTVNVPGFYLYSNTVKFVCDGTITVNLLPITGPPAITFEVIGACGLPLPGAMVTINKATYITGADGTVAIGLTDAGDYTYTVSKNRFVTSTGTITLTGCILSGGTVGVNLVIAPGFAPAPCLFTGGPIVLADPVPVTLRLVDSVYGRCDFVWTPGNPTGVNWIGSLVGPYPGGQILFDQVLITCPTMMIPINYSLPDCNQACDIQVGVEGFGDPFTGCPFAPFPGSGGVRLGILAGTAPSTLSPTIPFNWETTVPPYIPLQPGLQGSPLYPGGGVITITEP